MKQIFKKMIVMLLLFSLISVSVTGCVGQGAGGETPMGRFVEDALELPFDNENPVAQLSGKDGSIDIITMDAERNMAMYSTACGESWTRTAMEWKFPEEKMPMNFAYDHMGNLIIAVMEFGRTESSGSDESSGVMRIGSGDDDDGSGTMRINPGDGDEAPGAMRISPGDMTLRVYRASGSELEEMNIRWSTGHDQKTVMISDMKFLDNGDMVVGRYGVGIEQYGADGAFKRVHGGQEIGEFTVSGDKIYICDVTNNSIVVYDGNTFEQVSNLNFDALSHSTGIMTGQKGVVYLYGSSGVFRLLPEGSIFEKIIEGDLTSLSMPNYYLQGFFESADGKFFVLANEGAESILLCYTYDPNIPARPEKEIVVFALYENMTIRQAAGIFQKLRPEIKINIQVGMGDDAATVSDIIRTLNTEILAGRGPDIIVLDGLNAANYIDRGILLDITDLIEEKISSEPMIENVLRAFERNGKIFGAPAKFSMPLIYADEAAAESMADIRSLADFAEANGNRGIIGNKTGDNLSSVFLPAGMPGWFDGSEINEDKLRAYLLEIKRIADTPADVITHPERDMQGGRVMFGRAVSAARNIGASSPDDPFNFAFGDVHTLVANAVGFRSLMTANVAGEHRGGAAAFPLPGLVPNVFIPSAVTGVNAQSANIDDAKDFINAMLSKEIQSIPLGDGFPVSIGALEDSTIEQDNLTVMMMSTDVAGRMLAGGALSAEAQQKIMELCLSVKTPFIADDTLVEMVLDEARGYFSGEKDIDQTIADIRERTRIYIAE